MSHAPQAAKPKRSALRWIGGALALGGVGVTALILWFAGVSLGDSDPLFRGKPESEWIKNLKYWDAEQVKEWRGYGEEGVQVLIRGLEHADHPGERAYRQFCRRWPWSFARWLPTPKPDSTRSTRMCLVSLLSSLGNDARSATPIMIQALNSDEDDSVRQSTINFFTTSEDEKCLLNLLPAAEKQKLLPALIRGLQNTANWGLRNNAANALKWFPEEKKVVAPALVAALQDPQPQVRLLAAEALGRVDPDAAKKAGALSVVIAISKLPDDQVASRAVAALKFFPDEPEPAIRALIESLESTNSLVACQSVWSLEWPPDEYKRYADLVVPALQKAAARTNNVGSYARAALKRWKPKSNPDSAAK